MGTQVNTKVRLVKCPKCRKLLAELPEISVYKCGGCGTVLQAKIRKLETNISGLSSQETVSASKSQLDDVPNHDLTRSPKVESSSDRSLSYGLSSSRDVSSSRSEDSPPQLKRSPEYPLEQDPKVYQSKLHDDNEDKDEESRRVLDDVSHHDSPKVESSVDRSASDGLSSLRDVTSPRSEDSPLQVKESPKYPLSQDPEGYVRELHDSNGERAADSSFSNELSSSSEITHEDETYVREESEQVEKHDQQESALPERVRDNCAPSENDEKSSADQNGESAEVGVENDESIRAPGSPLNGSLVSFYLTTDDEHLNHSPGRPARNFERFSSIDTLRSSHLNSESNFRHNFPRNGSYYSYDGSESSYDGTDYQVHDHISHHSRKNRNLDYMRTSEVLRKDSFGGNNHAMKNSHWNQGTSAEASRSHTGHRAIFKNQHNLRPPRPGFNLRDPPLYSDPEKIDLLRTVCELKDQLNRMQFPKVSSNQQFPEENFSGFRHDHVIPDHNPVQACGERCKVSRMAFSGEAAYYRHPISCSCLHYSTQLPSCSMHCKNGHHVVHTDHNSYNSYNSPSPHHYTSSELSLHGCDSKSETQRLDEMKRLHLREKYKRHLRPIAGGAPIVACYHCWEVLQLPVDFVLFKKRYHKLMCSGCRKVLKFSILKGTHIVPYNDAPAPPPSEADDFSNARRLDPPSRSSSCHHVDPVSYSDDYGREFCRSCSTEEEALGIVPPLERVQRELYHRKMSSGSSHQPMEDRKMKGVLMDSPNSVEPVGPSSRTPKFRKFTSEIEEVEPSSTSPLHRLMGYPSPSHVLSR